MKRFLLLFAFASLTLPACKKAEEKATEPSVFKVFPKSVDSESGFAHSISVKVTCDIAFEYALEDGSWITINARDKDSRNTTTLILEMTLNDGEASRKDILTIASGSRKTNVNITQNPISSGLPVQEVRLKYIFPGQVTLQFPADWSLSSDASWLDFEPAQGSMNIITSVRLKANEFNFTGESRSARLLISFDGASIELPVVQESSLPSGAFAEKAYGLYNYDKAGSSVIYDPLAHQTNLVNRTDGSLFRLVHPAEARMYEISGLPVSYAPGDSLHLTIYQNWIRSMDFRSEKDAWVIRTEGSVVWLIDRDDRGYVVKK